MQKLFILLLASVLLCACESKVNEPRKRPVRVTVISAGSPDTVCDIEYDGQGRISRFGNAVFTYGANSVHIEREGDPFDEIYVRSADIALLQGRPVSLTYHEDANPAKSTPESDYSGKITYTDRGWTLECTDLSAAGHGEDFSYGIRHEGDGLGRILQTKVSYRGKELEMVYDYGQEIRCGSNIEWGLLESLYYVSGIESLLQFVGWNNNSTGFLPTRLTNRLDADNSRQMDITYEITDGLVIGNTWKQADGTTLSRNKIDYK